MADKKLADRPLQYVAPDGSTFLSAGQDFVDGVTSWTVKSADLVRGFGLDLATQGQPHCMSNERDVVTYVMDVLPDGNVTNVRPFVWQGGESVTVDSAGNVYIANGDNFVYTSAGTLIDRIRTPERPTNLLLAGPTATPCTSLRDRGSTPCAQSLPDGRSDSASRMVRMMYARRLACQRLGD